MDHSTAAGGSSRADRLSRNGRIWPAVAARDANALITLAVDVFGFQRQLVVPGEQPDEVVHSQLVWPEGGVVQISSAGREGSEFSRRDPGTANIYVVTDDPTTVHQRCTAANLELVIDLSEPEYDPGGLVFGVRDPEGNLWSFGTYPGE